MLGEEIDGEGDPPRVFAKGSTGPGCAFTRSIGDFYAEKIGVIATPELTTVQLHERMEVHTRTLLRDTLLHTVR